MAEKIARAVVVGAGSSLGRELAEQLNASTAPLWDVVLVDTESAGQMTATGDEAALVLPLSADVFEKADIVFFAGDPALTLEHWKTAQAAGAGVVDLTGALPDEAKALLLAPGLSENGPDLTTQATSILHPAAWMLASILRRIPELSFAALSVMLPASTFGDKAMDELQKQTVALLSFQGVPTEVFDRQLAFSLHDEVSAEAGRSLATDKEQIKSQLRSLLPHFVDVALTAAVAPVFHGLLASIFITTGKPTDDATLSQLLNGEGVEVVTSSEASEDISNASVNGQGNIFIRMTKVEESRNGYWLWVAADNLHMSCRNAILNAAEMLRYKPTSVVQ